MISVLIAPAGAPYVGRALLPSLRDLALWATTGTIPLGKVPSGYILVGSPIVIMAIACQALSVARRRWLPPMV